MTNKGKERNIQMEQYYEQILARTAAELTGILSAYKLLLFRIILYIVINLTLLYKINVQKCSMKKKRLRDFYCKNSC